MGRPSGPIIDANMHWLPERLFSDPQLLEDYMQSVPRQHGTIAKVSAVPGKQVKQMTIEQPPGFEVLNYVDGEYKPDFRIAAMNAAKVDMAIFRMPCWQEWLDLDLCRKANDGMAEHMKLHPGRFQALAGPSSPFGHPGSFGHPGAGGSFGFADPQAGTGYAYVTNRMSTTLPFDPRDVALRNALDRSSPARRSPWQTAAACMD
jgi:CubicO group peptidase (beta-lactamase class C family)